MLVVLVIALQGCAESAARPGTYLVRIDETDPEWIAEPHGAPVWSPSGSDLAWGSEDGLLRQSIERDAPVVVSRAAVAGQPAWSPDGRAIAFVDRAQAALVVLAADGGDPRFSVPLSTRDAAADTLAVPVLGGPTWSPDGTQIAFNCWDGAGDELCVIGADGTNLRQVTRIEPRRESSGAPSPGAQPAAANTGPAAWSPDGSLLAVAVYPERRGVASGVFVVDLRRGTASRVSALLPNSPISWTSGGGSIIFSATERGRSDVHRLSRDGQDDENLTEHLPGGGRQPSVSNDGELLAVVSGREIVILDQSGDVDQYAIAELRPSYPAWSPTGNTIAVTAANDPLLVYD